DRRPGPGRGRGGDGRAPDLRARTPGGLPPRRPGRRGDRLTSEGPHPPASSPTPGLPKTPLGPTTATSAHSRGSHWRPRIEFVVTSDRIPPKYHGRGPGSVVHQGTRYGDPPRPGTVTRLPSTQNSQVTAISPGRHTRDTSGVQRKSAILVAYQNS